MNFHSGRPCNLLASFNLFEQKLISWVPDIEYLMSIKSWNCFLMNFHGGRPCNFLAPFKIFVKKLISWVPDIEYLMSIKSWHGF